MTGSLFAVGATERSAAGRGDYAGRGILAALNGGLRVWHLLVNGALYVTYLTAVLV